MSVMIAVVGVETLVLLAVLIGAASGHHARDAAWRGIANERRVLSEARSFGVRDSQDCEGCPFRRDNRDDQAIRLTCDSSLIVGGLSHTRGPWGAGCLSSRPGPRPRSPRSST